MDRFGSSKVAIMYHKDPIWVLRSFWVLMLKSYIVAIEKIENIERSRIKISDRMIPISETYKDDFYNTLKNKKMMI